MMEKEVITPQEQQERDDASEKVLGIFNYLIQERKKKKGYRAKDYPETNFSPIDGSGIQNPFCDCLICRTNFSKGK